VPAKIRLSYQQIARKSKERVLLSKAQKEKLNESKQLKKGLVLQLDYDQLKTGGLIPALIAAFPTIMGILGGLGGGEAGGAAILNAVNTTKQQRAEEEEIKRHSQEMEKIAKEKQALNITGPG